MTNSVRIVALWLAACPFFGEIRGGTAPARDLVKPDTKKTMAEADIILYISPPNNTTETKRLDVKFLTGRRLIVHGTADIDGKTFRYGIKVSREVDEGSDKSESGFGVDQRPGETFVVVGHYYFDLEEMSGAHPKAAPLTARWIGRPCIDFTNLSALPANIDEIHSSVQHSIPSLD